MTNLKIDATCDWTVTGMDCGSCASKVKDAVGRLPGVSRVELGLMSERLRLRLDETQTGRDQIERIVTSLGYGITARHEAGLQQPQPRAGAAADATAHDANRAKPGIADVAPDSPASQGRRWFQTGKGRLVILTALLLGLAWAVEFLAPALGAWPFAAACLISLAPVARRALVALRLGQPFTIESLMTVAATGALFIGAAEEAAVVVFLFAVGEVLEGIAAGKARDGIRALAGLVPKTAQLLDEGGGTRQVPAASLAIGQKVLVRPGERIPADGKIAEGTSGVDDSPVTGESMPVTKRPGDAVFAGSINTEAALAITVTKAAEDNTIARIVRLVEEAEEARAPTQRFIDRFSRWYMPAIVTVAALVALLPPLAFGQDWDIWIYRGLALLLIGCPCALVISVPASIASALSTGARHGLLMKGGAVIEAAAEVRQVAFDKTGTLTLGRPVVTDIHPFATTTEAELLAVAAGVETGSRHPLAMAILARAAETGLLPPQAMGARALIGQGARAEINGATVWVASPRFAADHGGLDSAGQHLATRFETQGKTTVAVFREKAPLGLIAMRDEPRADAKEAIAQLERLGVSSIILTGDNPRSAGAIAAELGMAFRAGMMPEDKLGAISELRDRGGVMMIGDGINDAPALKQADVGMAMGSGTDVALETADAAILRDRVIDIAATIRLARAAMTNIHQNVAIALGLKAVFLVTSVIGVTGLWIAIMADTGATVLVTLNALRLLRFTPEHEG